MVITLWQLDLSLVNRMVFVGPHSEPITATPFIAGGAWRDISPSQSLFLYGYPHVPRLSTGVHDPLLATALYLANEESQVILAHLDVIWLSKTQVADVRTRISKRTGIATSRIMVLASHTHSGPVTVPVLSNIDDPVVPAPDPAFVQQMIQGVVDASETAMRSAVRAEIAFATAASPAIGSNRLDPVGPKITEVPVIAVRSTEDHRRWIGAMFVNPVHPTVLHQDSTMLSGDLPSMCRQYLRTHMVGADCPVLCPLGTAGNQSPRHVAKSYTFTEAERLGFLLGESIERALTSAEFRPNLTLRCNGTMVELLPRQMPSVAEATVAVDSAQKRLSELREAGAATGEVRSAECAVFGATESLALAKAASTGALFRAQQSCLPAEIQLIDFGKRTLVGWPGEVFVEFGLKLQERYPRAFVVTLANGELQGYLVTAEAVQQQSYEAGNAVFASPASGEQLVEATIALLANWDKYA
jgi:neutral ceramidase